MKLTRVRVKDFRSFAGEHEFDVASRVNYFVGPNNCGKSNLIKALELALDPDATYLLDRDRPSHEDAKGAPPKSRITVTFQVGKTPSEKTLLVRAREYELAVRQARGVAVDGNIRTYADDNEIRMVTSFGAGGVRQTAFQAKGQGATAMPADSAEHVKLLAQFRAVTRFAVVHSGEDLASLLAGKFREILQLVIADHLKDELSKAQAAREEYLAALQSELLEPLRSRVQERVGSLFPEIAVATLIPDVPTVGQTLSSVDVRLGDTIRTTGLTEKGTGVRGAVLVSMLQYLAEQSRRSLVLAVEEPEAFLHPAAQEAIRGELEALAGRQDVTLLVTSHSPYVISRQAESLVTELRKSADGVTSRAAVAAGDASRDGILSSLYRDPGLARVVERSLDVPATAHAVVVTEGYTDDLFLRMVCEATDNEHLLDGIHFIPAGNAVNVVPQALVAEAATDLPVIALLDADKHGREAADKLKSFNWETNKRILMLSKWPGSCKKNHDTEIEDLLPVSAVRKLTDLMGENVALDAKENCNAGWHYRVSKAWKSEAIERLDAYLPKTDPGGMIWLANELQARAAKLALGKASAKGHHTPESVA